MPLEEAENAQAHSAQIALEGSSESPSREVFTVANAITFTRLILTLVFLWLFGANQSREAAIIVYIVAAVTDFLDGMLARNTGSVSWLGKVLDPIVDRLLLFTGVIGLLLRGELPIWVAVLVISRDLLLALGMQILHKYRARPVDVVFIGKLTTALLLIGFTLMLIGQPQIDGLGLCDVPWLPVLNHQGGAVGILFVYVGCITSVITFAIYLYEGLKIRSDAISAGWKRESQ